MMDKRQELLLAFLGRVTDVRHANAADRLTSETVNGVARTYGYDVANQLTNDNGTPHTYDKAGNRTDPGYVTGPGNRLLSDGTWSYTYDDAGHLVKKSKGAAAETWTYSYDAAGQLTAASKSASDGGPATDTVGFTYDAYGNRLTRTAWNASSGTTTERYAYDGWDTAKPDPVGGEAFDAWIDLDGAGNVTARRLFGPGFDDPLARQDAAGNVAWYGADRLGSVRLVFDNAGTITGARDYAGFGAITAASGSGLDRYSFAGMTWDPTLQMYGSHTRWLQADRWTAEDPIGLSGGDYNLDRYVGNSPTNRTDPSGLFWFGKASWLPGEPAEKLKAELEKARITVYLIDSDVPVVGGPTWTVIYVPKDQRAKLREWLKSQGYDHDVSFFGDLMDDDRRGGNIRVGDDLGFTTGDLDGISQTDRAWIKSQIDKIERDRRERQRDRIEPLTPEQRRRLESSSPDNHNGTGMPIVTDARRVFEGTVDPPLNSAACVVDSVCGTELNPHTRDARAGKISREEAEKRKYWDGIFTAIQIGGAIAGRALGGGRLENFPKEECPPSSKGTATAPVAGTRPGGTGYWSDLKILHHDQAGAVLGQIDNTCGIGTLQSVLLRRGVKPGSALEKEMIAALTRKGGQIEGLELPKLYESLQKAGVNPSRPKLMTADQLKDALKPGESAIVMISRDGKYHYVVVEGFSETYFTGGYRVPLVQIVDTNEAARLYVTQAEFAQRLGEVGAGKGPVIIIPGK